MSEPQTDPPDRTLADKAYRRLRDDILAGKRAPDERLKLVELQKIYGIGISPLRESLMRLEGDGLVVSEGQKGFAVASVSLAELIDLTRTRQQLERLMIEAACARGDADWEAGIVAAFHRLSRTPLPGSLEDSEAGAAWEGRHRAFHHALIAACGSPWLLRFHAQLVDHSQRYRRIRMFRAQPAEPARNVEEEHRAIMDAVLARDAERAAKLLAAHLGRTAEIVKACWEAAEDAIATATEHA